MLKAVSDTKSEHGSWASVGAVRASENPSACLSGVVIMIDQRTRGRR